jgi:hypothetical protein
LTGSSGSSTFGTVGTAMKSELIALVGNSDGSKAWLVPSPKRRAADSTWSRLVGSQAHRNDRGEAR